MGATSSFLHEHSKEAFLISVRRRSIENAEAIGKSSVMIKNIAHKDSSREFDNHYQLSERNMDEKIHEFVKEIYHSVCGFEVLDNVLKNKSGVEALLTFLKQEYCEENLQFYMDVEAARKGASINVSTLNMRHLLDTYLINDAPQEVIYIYIHNFCNNDHYKTSITILILVR